MTARIAKRATNRNGLPVNRSYGNWNAAPNGVQLRASATLRSVNDGKSYRLPESAGLSMMFGSWHSTMNTIIAMR